MKARTALCALLLMGAAEVQPSGRILVTTSDYTVIAMVRELDQEFPNLLKDPTAPQDQVDIEVVDDLVAAQGQIGASKGERIWGQATHEGLGDNHHQIKLNARIFKEPFGHVIFLSILAHELVHVGLFARGEVPTHDDFCGKVQHEIAAYSMQAKVEKWKLGHSLSETQFVIMQMQHLWIENCTEDAK